MTTIYIYTVFFTKLPKRCTSCLTFLKCSISHVWQQFSSHYVPVMSIRRQWILWRPSFMVYYCCYNISGFSLLNINSDGVGQGAWRSLVARTSLLALGIVCWVDTVCHCWCVLRLAAVGISFCMAYRLSCVLPIVPLISSAAAFHW